MKPCNLVSFAVMTSLVLGSNAQISEIINGTEMLPGSRPYLVSIGFNSPQSSFGVHNCGGSLISPRAILTAAHCVMDSFGAWTPPDWIDFERHDLRDPPPRRRSFFHNGPNLIVHPQWNVDTFAFDAAILILTPGDAIHEITPVQLNENPFVPHVDDPLDIAGWGFTENFVLPNLPPPVFLPTHITVAYTDQSTADGICPREPFDLCTIDNQGGIQRVCAGDSGGPLVVSRGEPDLGPVFPAIQVGIVSRGEPRFSSSGYCGVNIPTVYTRIAAVSAWVKKTVCTQVGELCPPTRTPTAKPTSVNGKSSKKRNYSKGSK